MRSNKETLFKFIFGQPLTKLKEGGCSTCGDIKKYEAAGNVSAQESTSSPNPTPTSAPTPTPATLSLDDQYLLMQQRYADAQAALQNEQDRVNRLRTNLIKNAKDKDAHNTPTRTDLSWIDEDNGRYFCSSHTCELLADSGYTDTKTGKKFPLIPGNIQFASDAPQMGFQIVKTPQVGDVTQELVEQDEDYQGNPWKNGWMPAHSLIYAGDQNGQQMFWNAPHGKRDLYDKTPITTKHPYKLQYFRYVGNTPQLQKKADQLNTQLSDLKYAVNNQQLTPETEVFSNYLNTAVPEKPQAIAMTATPQPVPVVPQEHHPNKLLKEIINQVTTKLKPAQDDNSVASTMKMGGWLSKYKNGGENWQPNQEDLRADGTQKGTGYLGVLNRPDGGVSSELSMGVEIDGKEVQIPTMVPTLNPEEINYLLNTPTDEDLMRTEIGKRIMDKAYNHAMMRMDQGMSPFYQEGEERQDTGVPRVQNIFNTEYKRGGVTWLNEYQDGSIVMPPDVMTDPRKLAQWMKDYPEFHANVNTSTSVGSERNMPYATSDNTNVVINTPKGPVNTGTRNAPNVQIPGGGVSKNTVKDIEILLDLAEFYPPTAVAAYIGGIPFTVMDLYDDYKKGSQPAEYVLDALGLIPGEKLGSKAASELLNLANFGADVKDYPEHKYGGTNWLNQYAQGGPTMTFNTMPVGTMGVPAIADNTKTYVQPVITKEERNKAALKKLQNTTNEHVAFTRDAKGNIVKDTKGNPTYTPAKGTTYGDNGNIVAGAILAPEILGAAGSLMGASLPIVGTVGNALTYASIPGAAWNAAQGNYTDAALLAAPWALGNVGKAVKALGTEEGLLSNTYKINPWAEKLINPNKSYRVAGLDALEDFQNTGVLKSKSPVPPVNSSLLERAQYRPTSFPSFQKGFADMRYASPEGSVVFETSLPTYKRGEINPVTGFPIKGSHYAHRVIDPVTGKTLTEIPASEITAYNGNPHWLQGYKPIQQSVGTAPQQAGMFGNVGEMFTNPAQYFTKPGVGSYSQEFKTVIDPVTKVKHIEYNGYKVPVYGTINTGDNNWNIVNAFTADGKKSRDIMNLVNDNGEFQHFYKSSGTNSGKTADDWYPYQGQDESGWFIKGATPEEARSYQIYPKTDPRFGKGSTEQYRLSTILNDQYPHPPGQDPRISLKVPIMGTDLYDAANFPEYFFNGKMTYANPVYGNAMTNGLISQARIPQYNPNFTFFNPQQMTVPRVIDWDKIAKAALTGAVATGAATAATAGLQQRKYGGWLDNYES